MKLKSLRNRVRANAHRVLIAWGIDTRRLRPDRVMLERTIFPALMRDEQCRRILFVGCDWYTLHYPRLLRGKQLITLEMNPDLARYGASHHIVDGCENISNYFKDGELDCVILNGVFGFGLDHMAAINQTFHGIHQSLRSGGLLVFGWNDLPTRVPCPVTEIGPLARMRPFPFPGVGMVHESSNKNRHRFQFFERLAA